MRKTRRLHVGVMAALVAGALFCPSVAMAEESSIPAGTFSGDVAIQPYKNNIDEAYHFDLWTAGQTAGTNYREKQDSSATYINIQQYTARNTNLYVDGSNTQSGGVNTNDWDVSARLGQYLIHNECFEWGYRYARLTALTHSGGGIMAGVWSPDSQWSYPSL